MAAAVGVDAGSDVAVAGGAGSAVAVAGGAGSAAAVAVGVGSAAAVAVGVGSAVAVAVGAGSAVAVAVGAGSAVAVAVRAALTVARTADTTVASRSGVAVRLLMTGVVMGAGGEGTGEIVGTMGASLWAHAEIRKGIATMSRDDFLRI